MLFNSIEYLIFLPIIFIIYWKFFNKSVKYQNHLLLLASYFFYGWWDYRFLSLIIISTVVDYVVGLKIHDSSQIKIKKRWLSLSILLNISLLGFFKYCNFFIDSWIDLWATVGYELSPYTLKVILPVGISFYTFQTLFPATCCWPY
jgi:D-alanyl-lipoteichoic acid acyltransferase DltB (MBOAT superfamily)